MIERSPKLSEDLPLVRDLLQVLGHVRRSLFAEEGGEEVVAAGNVHVDLADERTSLPGRHAYLSAGTAVASSMIFSWTSSRLARNSLRNALFLLPEPPAARPDGRTDRDE